MNNCQKVLFTFAFNITPNFFVVNPITQKLYQLPKLGLLWNKTFNVKKSKNDTARNTTNTSTF